MLEYFVQRKDIFMTKTGSKQERYVARLNEKPLYTTKEICKDVAMNCTLSEAETELAIMEIQNAILKQLTNGRSVQLGQIGSLHPVIKAQSQTTEEQVTIKSIKNISCYFLPTRFLSKILKQTGLRKVIRKTDIGQE